MKTSISFASAIIIAIDALAACAIFSGAVQAKSPPVEVKISVSTAGLNLKQPAGAHELYRRLQRAAEIVCGYGNRVDLRPVEDVASCHQKAIGDAVRSVNAPLLTILYLETHTLKDAKIRGIDIPVLVAAK